VDSSIQNLRGLTHLSLGKNKIAFIEDDALSSLSNLVELDLH